MSPKIEKKSGVQFVTVIADDVQRRIDNFLMARLKGVPRTRVYQMLRRGEVRVNKGRVKQDYRIKAGDVVRIPPVKLEVAEAKGEPPRFLLDMLRNAVLYEDEEIIAINKPSGIVVHSGSGRSFGVIEVLRHLLPRESNLQLVHRLDQATSGCLLLSKSTAQLRNLQKAFREGQVSKNYQALLKGDLGKKTVNVSKALKKNIMSSGERMVKVDESGKKAQTRFVRRKLYRDSCLADIAISTGRTHQIRVHAMHLGHAVAGDDKYGDVEFNKKLRTKGLRRLFLHASELVLNSGTKKKLTIKAPLAEELDQFLCKHA